MTKSPASTHPFFSLIGAVGATALLTGPVLAGSGADALLAAQPQLLVRAEPQARQAFGSAVALAGDIAAVGAPGNDGPTEDAGAIFLYQRSDNGWQENGMLSLENVGVGAGLGYAVAVEDGWLAAGASGIQSGRGAVYLYREEGGAWQEQARLLLPGRSRNGFEIFGSALDLDAGVLVAGAPGHDGEAKNAGLVMAYRRTDDGSWTEGTALLPDVPVAGERFGTDVALDGGRLLVGAAGMDDAEAAYLFEYRNGAWQQVARLSEELGEKGGGYGAAVALQGDTALVGARRAPDDSGESRGAVFAYTLGDGGWTRQAVLHSDAPARGDQFGAALALDHGVALVSAPRDDAGADDAGAVFVFARDDGHWQLKGRLPRTEPASYANFGDGFVVLDGGRAWVGSPNDSAPDSDVRAAGVVTRYHP
ncbi:hypothetical protein CWI75_17275 [Kineobactrum sediminis]|uniref:Integrin n=1 Tax=Kineobactrum sediminis TaxID=1905677 RepID=A0A2N5XYF3_9GAMM|nr:hypothetical protein [Kineobactrum sediminis]PLW81184.1 hypothetical protein CWI75_17275 [Kineobactrum sediminis]